MVRPEAAIPLSKWLSPGATSAAYSVRKFGQRSIEIDASKIDFQSALLSDVELLMDHCFEQLSEIGSSDAAGEMRSPAWTAVSIYYFAFFVGQLFQRIVGEPVLFLDRDRQIALRTIATSVFGKAGSGAYRLRSIQTLSTSQCALEFVKCSERIHEELWKRMFVKVNDLRAGLPRSGNEYDLLTSLNALCRRSIYDGFDWPIRVRNKVNYSIGLAFQAVAGKDVIAVNRVLRDVCEAFDQDRLHIYLVNVLHGKNDLADQHWHEQTSAVFATACYFFGVSRKLYRDLLERTTMDKRWERRRVTYSTRLTTSVPMLAPLFE